MRHFHYVRLNDIQGCQYDVDAQGGVSVRCTKQKEAMPRVLT